MNILLITLSIIFIISGLIVGNIFFKELLLNDLVSNNKLIEIFILFIVFILIGLTCLYINIII